MTKYIIYISGINSSITPKRENKNTKTPKEKLSSPTKY